jgi:hypothetical protein
MGQIAVRKTNEYKDRRALKCATSNLFQTMEEFYFSDFSILQRQRQTKYAVFSQAKKSKERTSMTRTPSVRECVARFMEAMHRKDFAEAKRIRKFTRSMCSPQHWSTECRLWLERNPDTDPALKSWFERACQEHKRSLDPDPQYLQSRPCGSASSKSSHRMGES